MKNILTETFNLQQKFYKTKSGKSPLLIYVDKNTSTDNPYDSKEKFKEYGMVYLPSKLGNYAPHNWGWILWDGENDRQMGYVKKFINDLPTLETAPDTGTRGFEDITSNLEGVVREILKDIEETEAKMPPPKTQLDAETKKRIEDFKVMVQNGLDNDATARFIENIIRYRAEARKRNLLKLGWTNMMLAYLARDGEAYEIRPLKQWLEMGYQPKKGVPPIGLIGKGHKYIPYTQAQKEKVIQSYLAAKGVSSIEELPKSSYYDLKNRKLKGRPVPGSEYQYSYEAYDRNDVEPIEGAEVETPPEAPEKDWWWDTAERDEKDIKLTNALIAFAQSDECGNIRIKDDNTAWGLGGARGNAGGNGRINLIGDGKMVFPTAVHELTHAIRHTVFASKNNPALKRFYNGTADEIIMEDEAELCAAFVASKYGYDIQPHLNYLKTWHLDKYNCNKVFDQIADVADFIENGVEKYLALQEK